MELTPQEKSRAFWSGATSGIFSGVGLGMAVALGAGALLLAVGAVTPAAWGLAALFGPFITLPGVALPFFPVPLMIFNTALTVVGNAINGGNAAVEAYKQQKVHGHYEAKIAELEGREQMVEQAISHPRSVRVDSIIRTGPRPMKPAFDRPGTLTVDTILRDGAKTQEGFTAAEEAREAQPSAPTLH